MPRWLLAATAALAAACAPASHARPTAAGNDAVTLTYPGHQQARLRVRSRGYIVELRPSHGEDEPAGSVDIVLRTAARPQGRNLVEPQGNYHLLQSFYFRAEDCPWGGQFGPLRMFTVPEQHVRLIVRLTDCRTQNDGQAFAGLTVIFDLEPH